LMVWDRASADEFDSWEQVGNPGWNWKSLLAAMERSENFTGLNSAEYGSAGAGTRGPVRAVINRINFDHQKLFIATAHDHFNLPTNLESLAGNSIGVERQPSSIDATSYTRSYSASAYLPIAGENLAVATNTKVVKINFRKVGGLEKVTGVTLENGTVIGAAKEVILSAGSIQSPGLLELSGIGRASVLAAAGIPQLVNLPGVGENLQDHLRFGVAFQLKDNYLTSDILWYNATAAAEQLALWKSGKVSLYDYTPSNYIYANWKQVAGNDSYLLSLAQAAVGESNSPIDQTKLKFLRDCKIPQGEVIFSDGYAGLKGYPPTNSPLYGKGFSTIIPILMHPLSRGSVHINSTNPRGSPVIDPKWLNNAYDVEALVTLAKFVRQLANAPPLKDALVGEYEPGLDAVHADAQWREYIRNTTLSVWHPVSTCAMLPRKQGGVVDPKLRVYGTSGLRIADASVFPVQISAHIQTAVYGVAERAAEIILADALGISGA